MKKKKIFAGKLLNLFVKKERLPGGYLAHLEVIEHPGAVLIVPIMNNKKVIFIRQFRPVINSYIWELPAGTLNKNESPLKCAKRETKEEIGYAAKEWKRIGHIYPAPGYTTEKIIIFKARGLKKVRHKKELDEVIRPNVFSEKEIKRLLRSGRIVDAKTICALKLAGIF